MILPDTSVWVDHLRYSDERLVDALEGTRVLTHPFVIGELACGQLRDRRLVLDLLAQLPRAPVATDPEALAFIEARRLMGTGIGYVDVHLLASTALGDGVRLWTRDRRLAEVARDLDLAALWR
jgi:predicted nucleic acid-binding protein